MADIGKEAQKINEDLNQVNGLVSNPLFKWLLYLLGAAGVLFLLALLILKL